MSNELLYREIQSLERKVRMLLSEFDRVNSEMQRKSLENAQLKEKMKVQQENLRHFQNKYNISKLVNTRTSGKDEAEEMKKMLDGYIQEIDRCIAHLGEA